MSAIRGHRQPQRPPPARGSPSARGAEHYEPGPYPQYSQPVPFEPPWAGEDRRQPGPPGARWQRGAALDVHELLKREAFAAETGPPPGGDGHFERNKPDPGRPWGVSDQHVVLDSFLKLRESQVDRGEFRWNFMVQGVTGDDVIGIRDRADTVIEVQMAGFCLPVLEEVPYVLRPAPLAPTGTDQLVLLHNNTNAAPPFSPTLVPNVGAFGQYPPQALLPPATVAVPWLNNPYTQLPHCGRLTVQLREAGLQSYSGRNGARHHFEFNVGYLGDPGANPTVLEASPLSGHRWDSFVFTDPLKDVHGLTLVFRNPDAPVSFRPDCLYDAAVESDLAAAPGPFLRFRIPGHGLNAGDRFFVAGFASGNPGLDAYVNRPEGHVVGGDPSLAPLPPGTPVAGPTFYSDPAISLIDLTVVVPALPQLATVCIAKRRLLLRLRLRSVVGRLTNYIKPI